MFFNYELFRTVNHLLETSTGKIALRGLNRVMPLFRMTVCTMGTEQVRRRVRALMICMFPPSGR